MGRNASKIISKNASKNTSGNASIDATGNKAGDIKNKLTTYGKKKFDKDTSFIQNYPKLSKIISNYLTLISNSSSHIEHFAIYGKNAPKNPQKPSAHKSKYSAYGQNNIIYII